MDRRAAGGAAADPQAEGWRHLAAFSREGARRLAPALAALREAERAERAEGAAGALVNTLLGLSFALRLLRDAGEARRAVVLARELVNIVRRARGEAEAVAYRTHLEAAYVDLARVERGAAAGRAADEGIGVCDRTLALARRVRVSEAVPRARAAKAALLGRAAAVRGAPDAVPLRRAAERLYAAALQAWPERDAVGRAQVQLDFAEALAGRGEIVRAGPLVREGSEVLRAAGDRYLEARAARAGAAVAVAAGTPDALDLIERAAAAFRALGCEWDAREVEARL